MEKEEIVIGHVYAEYEPKVIADYGIIIYRVILEENKMYLVLENRIRTTFLRESLIYELKQNGYVSLEQFKKRYKVDHIPLKKQSIKNIIKDRIGIKGRQKTKDKVTKK